jgi:hypothetical protein
MNFDFNSTLVSCRPITTAAEVDSQADYCSPPRDSTTQTQDTGWGRQASDASNG